MEVDLKLRVEQGDIATAGGPAVAVNLYEGVTEPGGATAAVDEAAGGVIARALASGDFKGALEETLILYPAASGEGVPERVILLGLGKKEEFKVESARRVGGALVRALRKLKVESAVTVVHGGDSGPPVRDLARGLAEGIVLGAYRYDDWFRDGRREPLALKTLTVLERLKGKLKTIEAGLRHGEAVAHAVNQARELANGPANYCTPGHLADTARKLGKAYGFKVKVLERADCEKLGMGAFMGVARGAKEPPKFLIMEYEGPKAKSTVCLVGKGITFDSGGISLKPGADMDLMKFDMGGSAAVIGAMRFAAETRVPLRVVGLVAATNNMPDGDAYKPGDVLTSMAGVTIEVKNTDAEGRLVLADALAYAERFEPDAVVDLATLTGACVIALGSHACGLMGNDEWLMDAVHSASNEAGERAWPLPLWSEYREMVKSDVADIKNTAGRDAGAITAGAFLGAFTNAYRWVHLDIAGTAWNGPARPYNAPGGTGAGVRILAELLTTWKKPSGKGPQPGPRTSLRSLPKDLPGPFEGGTAAGAAGAAKARPGAKAKPTARGAKPGRTRRR